MIYVLFADFHIHILTHSNSDLLTHTSILTCILLPISSYKGQFKLLYSLIYDCASIQNKNIMKSQLINIPKNISIMLIPISFLTIFKQYIEFTYLHIHEIDLIIVKVMFFTYLYADRINFKYCKSCVFEKLSYL